MPENALFQGYFAEVRFETLEENQLSYVQNGYLAKFFDDLMNHIAREYAGKKNEIISECFTITNCKFTFVTF